MVFDLIVQKLKREWKTFTLAIATTVAGAWELASSWGADVPSFFDWVPDKYRSGVLFAVGLGFLLLRKYTPTTVVLAPDLEPLEPVTPEPPPVV